MSNILAKLQTATRKKGVVGAAMGFIENGKTQFYYFGKKSVQSNTSISIDSVFEIGSITKVFTTLLLMILSHKGEVSLDDPIDIFLPFDEVPHFNGHRITLRHLASHSSGLPSIPSTFVPKNPRNPYRDFTVEYLYDFLKQYTLQKTPGEQFTYSNLGIGLLGHILALKTKKSYEILISDYILIPLSMQDTRTEVTDQMCTGHNIGKKVEFWDMPEAIVGAGGLRSTIRDMTQFLAANLGFIYSPFTDLLKRCHERLYKTPNPVEDIGFGWVISRSDNGEVIWHDGITGGFRSILGFNQNTQKGLVILANSREDWLNEFSFSLLTA